MEIFKYPRTISIIDAKPKWLHNNIVVEEKMDGCQAGIRFKRERDLFLFSRGHEITKEEHFSLFKQWANTHRKLLWDILGYRYIMFGEWLHPLHSIYYDSLPHYFMEFDIFDTDTKTWFNSENRHEILKGSSIKSVEIINAIAGKESCPNKIITVLKQCTSDSNFRSTEWKNNLTKECNKLDYNLSPSETDQTNYMEGYYIKIENQRKTLERLKSIRSGFIQTVKNAKHWQKRPLIPNKLKEGIDIWS